MTQKRGIHAEHPPSLTLGSAQRVGHPPGDEVQVPGAGIAFKIPEHDESVTVERSLISVTSDFETQMSSEMGTLHVAN